MTKYVIIHEEWKISGIFEVTRENFISCATDNPNGCENSEEIGTYDTLDEALAELSKYRCAYEKWENYNETRFDLYEIDEILYDDDDEIEDYRYLQRAEIEI